MKEYFIENLFKGFITLNKVFYLLSILFILKVNDNLRFCVNYRKLNVIIKKNRYSLSLIKKVIKKIMNYKHLTRLNIIAIFNKLRINFNNENFTTFITIFEIYKYKILSFELTNELNLFQQYINEVL